MIRLNINGIFVDYATTTFSDGAVSIKLTGAVPTRPETAKIFVLSEGKLNDEFFIIASLVDILRSINPRITIQLAMPYTPYARQDRRMVRHDAFSLNVFASMINALKFDSVIVIDAHSDVAPAVLNNCTNIPQDFVLHTSALREDIGGWADHLIAPDAGAAKKVQKAAKAIGFAPQLVTYMEKTRDVTNGNITGSHVLGDTSHLRDTHVVIVDDLCDGGGTFIQAAQALYGAGVAGVGLFVTHGIFSRGYQPLLDAGIDRIWTTDSFINGHDVPSKVKVMKTGVVIGNYFGVTEV